MDENRGNGDEDTEIEGDNNDYNLGASLEDAKLSRRKAQKKASRKRTSGLDIEGLNA